MTDLPERADYVIVGGGSAGCVLAHRLSEDPDVRVVLVEAGGEATSLMVQIPVGFARMLLRDRYDWQYRQKPDPSINGRRCIWSAGRMLGGGSSINGQVYIRGSQFDFEQWTSLGAAGWGWADVLPYFIRSETWGGAPGQGRGSHGPLSVMPMRDPHPLCRVFLDGCREFGLPTLEDYHDGVMEGAYLSQTTQRDGWRCSTEKAYLRPIRDRANLRVVGGAEVSAIRVQHGRAVGVDFRRGGHASTIEATREVIVSAGAIGSPALLMRSGIGPADDLRALGIAVLADRTEVGRNLQEHAGVGQSKSIGRPTLNSEIGPLDMLRHVARFAWNRGGPLGAPAVQAMGLVRSDPELPEPDLQLHFLPLAFDIEPDTLSAAGATMPRQPAVTINATLTRPAARGRVELDDDLRPVIDYRLLGDERDLVAIVGGLKLVDKLFATQAWRRVVLGNRSPDPVPTSDQGWIDYARAKTMVAYHPVGTCRMGSDAGAVVDPQGRVNGVDRLRVADASIMPCLTSGNTNATTIMIAEKLAESIASAAKAALAA